MSAFITKELFGDLVPMPNFVERWVLGDACPQRVLVPVWHEDGTISFDRFDKELINDARKITEWPTIND